MEETRVTLLSKIRNPGANLAWEEFYGLYAPVIINFAMRSGLDRNRAEDVLQETMMALLRLMPAFRYDRKEGLFRNYVLTIVRRKIKRAFEREQVRKEVSLSEIGTNFIIENMPDANAPPPDQQLELLWLQSLSEEALCRVAKEVNREKRTLEIYDAYAVRGRPAEEVAREFGVAVNVVYQVKNRIETRQREELKRLENILDARFEP
jgi:RNA polymerase sigma-70 factor, ECF subfamily